MIYHIGKIYGLLKVLALDPNKKRRSYYCQCACGNIVSVRSSDFLRTTSCGCLVKELRLKQKEKNKSNSFSSASHRLKYYLATRDLFEEIRKRDNNSCVFCNAESNLHVHHIVRKSVYPEYMFRPENLITLCDKCHIWEAHKGNTNTCDLTVARELLAISFINSINYSINESLVTEVTEKVRLIK